MKLCALYNYYSNLYTTIGKIAVLVFADCGRKMSNEETFSQFLQIFPMAISRTGLSSLISS